MKINKLKLIVIKYGKDETAKKPNSQEIAHVNWIKKIRMKIIEQ